MSAGHRLNALTSSVLLAVAACSSASVTPAAVAPLRIPANLPAEDPADTSTDTMPELDSTTRDPFDAWDHAALAESTDTTLGEGGGLPIVPGGEMFGGDSAGYGGGYGGSDTYGRAPSNGGYPGGTPSGTPESMAPSDGRMPPPAGWRPLWPTRDGAEGAAGDDTSTDFGADTGDDRGGVDNAAGFGRTRPPANEPPPVAREQAELIEVSSIINLGGGHRATIRSRRTGQERQVRAGDPVGEWQVESIDDDGLTLRLRTGKLQQRVPFQPGGLPSGIVFGAGRAEPFQP